MKIAGDLKAIVSQLIVKYSNFKILKDFVDGGNLVIEEIYLVKELLEVVNDVALTIIDQHMTIFVDSFRVQPAEKGDL